METSNSSYSYWSRPFKIVDGCLIPPPVTAITDGVERSNLIYATWLGQDQLLFGALVGTLFTNLLLLISREKSSKELRDTLAKTYATLTRGHIK